MVRDANHLHQYLFLPSLQVAPGLAQECLLQGGRGAVGVGRRRQAGHVHQTLQQTPALVDALGKGEGG